MMTLNNPRDAGSNPRPTDEDAAASRRRRRPRDVHRARSVLALIAAAALALPMMGCENLPGGGREQGAVIGGATGAAAGAAVAGEDNRWIGALLGGAAGAGGGWLIGAEVDKRDDPDDAVAANQQAQTDPATIDEVYADADADLNDDGFVTMDELIALSNSALSDDQVIARLQATDVQFQLTEQQRDRLLAQGVSQNVVDALPRINRDDGSVIGAA